ncbi:MAG: DNA alkylation repair protein [Burkholderiales bacterium]|jgi:3-methyladenine DNA glycosylase AlkC|nr:DNA alkylation repair protein [Burkholderiales bacterium]
MKNMAETNRKGARSIKDIPKDILEQLNRGEIETANLVEWLAIDRRALLESLLAQHGRKKYLKPILEQVNNLEKQTVNTIAESIGAGLFEQITIHKDDDFFWIISAHKSDFVRCWATCIVGKNTTLDIKQTLQKIQPLSADRHFNVRECAWAAVRQHIAQNLTESIAILSKWAADKDENIRRFASEATRPRGVWCEHIKELKQNPCLALSILEPLKSDKSRYVQNSVGNWLNDASKTQPDFVKELCKRWEKESDTKETRYIIKRALRTIAPSQRTAKKDDANRLA